jgi:predicted ATPase
MVCWAAASSASSGLSRSFRAALPSRGKPSEDIFRQALDFARRHGALSLALRAATSLARLLRDQGHQAEAIVCLQPIYERFTEGFDTADLIAAKGLLGALSGAQRLSSAGPR